MSIMCCLYVPEGIVMAADSRLTRTKPTKALNLSKNDGEQEKILYVETTYTLSDNAQKVLLIKKTNTGVSFCGDAMINDVTVADFIRKFEIEKVSEGDSTETVANKLSEYYSGGNTHFFVCGYNEDVPYVFDINNKKVVRSNISTVAIDVKNTNDAASEGDSQLGTDIPENIKCEHKKGSTISEDVVQYGAIWAGQKTAITKIVNNPPILNASWNTMPLKDAIGFAEFLVDATIKYERFCDDIQTCGGDIDILVITKDEAFWKRHKIFNPR